MRNIIIFTTLIFFSTALYADTVIMKNKTRVKGLVVDEYADRINLSTVDGEKIVMRSDIDRIEYDTPEQNFMQLGRSYDDKGWYDKAAYYYKKAMDVNPYYKEAREAYLASQTKMWREEERATKKEVDLRNMAIEWQMNKNKKEASVFKSRESLVRNSIGISLTDKDGVFKINEVVPGSSAAKAGIEKGDNLIAIWGRLIRYSKIEDVLNELSGPTYSEVKVMIEKDFTVPVEASKNFYKELGISLAFEYEGLAIKDVTPTKKAELSGLKKGDLIMAIDKNSTRYIPMDSIIALMSNPKNDRIIFTVRRNINLKRGGSNER